MPNTSTRRAKSGKPLIYRHFRYMRKRKKCKALHYTLHFLYTNCRIKRLPENKLEHGFGDIALHKVYAAVVLAHDLAGKGEADA